MASVVWNPQVFRDANFVLQDPKLKTLESRRWSQVFPTDKRTAHGISTQQSALWWRSASYKIFSPEVVVAGGYLQAYLKSKKSKAVIVSKTANWSTNSLKIITILWMRVLTLSILRSSRTWGIFNDIITNHSKKFLTLYFDIGKPNLINK